MFYTIYTIDRIESDKAVAFDENDAEIIISLEVLPDNVKEGDILKFDGEEYIIDVEQTAKVEADIKARFEKLLKKKEREN